MKLKLYVIGLVLMVFFGCITKTKEESKIQVENQTISKEIANKSLYEDLEGNSIQLSDYKGKRIVLNFWATWCVPCIKEMPSMLKLQEILENENYIFLLASDEPVEKIQKFIAKTNFKFNFIKFTGSLTQQHIYALPTTFVYNENGNKVDEIVGAVEWDSEEIIEKLKNIK